MRQRTVYTYVCDCEEPLIYYSTTKQRVAPYGDVHGSCVNYVCGPWDFDGGPPWIHGQGGDHKTLEEALLALLEKPARGKSRSKR